MISPNKKLVRTIEELATRIIQCGEKCEGIENNQKEGYYPRAFFLDPESTPQIDVAIIGENPGNSSCLEREFYLALAERDASEFATFEDCWRVWKSIAKQHDYYQRPKHLLKELGLSLKGILWAEVVFCEKSPSIKRIPGKTFEKCFSRFLTEVAKLLLETKYVVCLGTTAFQYVKNLPHSDQWKMISVYHPTGSRVFANYFKKEKGKKVTERKLRNKILKDFKQLENSHERYACKVRPDGIKLIES